MNCLYWQGSNQAPRNDHKSMMAELPMSGIWLNIGCGNKHLNGFVNMDIEKPYNEKLDARKGLPYADQAVDGVYSEHFFEHLTQAEGLCFLRECRRVLKRGGVVRIAMPDLDELVKRYMSEDWRGDGDMFKLGFDWVSNRCEMLNIAMREWGHKHVYNEEELVRIVSMAGLEPVARCAHGRSDVKNFVGRETRDGSKLIMEFRAPDRAVGASPLVSILIPAYRADWFRHALKSAQEQSYQNTEIIISDDSPNGEIENIVRSAMTSDSRIRYFRNDPAEGGLNNYLKLYASSRGEFIKFLNDDDAMDFGCIEKMINIFRKHLSVTLVTSRRFRIDEHGNQLPDIPATRTLSEVDVEVEGVSCANALTRSGVNFIGEPSTAMFRKKDLEWVQPHLMSFGGMAAIGAGDVAMWLNLLSRGNLYYIAEPLSTFRVHLGQRQNEPAIQKAGHQTWQGFFFHARRLGLLSTYISYEMKVRVNSVAAWRRISLKRPRSIGQLLREFRVNATLWAKSVLCGQP